MGAFEKVVRDNLLRYWNFGNDSDLVEMLVLSYEEKINLAKKSFATHYDVAAHIANAEKVAPIIPLTLAPVAVNCMA
jgi:hypothetical protein